MQVIFQVIGHSGSSVSVVNGKKCQFWITFQVRKSCTSEKGWEPIQYYICIGNEGQKKAFSGKKTKASQTSSNVTSHAFSHENQSDFLCKIGQCFIFKRSCSTAEFFMLNSALCIVCDAFFCQKYKAAFLLKDCLQNMPKFSKVHAKRLNFTSKQHQSKLYHQVISYAKKGGSALSLNNRLKRREIQISSVKNR